MAKQKTAKKSVATGAFNWKSCVKKQASKGGGMGGALKTCKMMRQKAGKTGGKNK